MILYQCDGCLWLTEAERGIKDELCRPVGWYVHCDDNGERHVCSKQCLDHIKGLQALICLHAKFPRDLLL